MNHHNRRGNETGVSSYDFHIPCWNHPLGSQARSQASLYQLLQISPLYEAFSPSIYIHTLELSTLDECESGDGYLENVSGQTNFFLFFFCYL